MLDAAETLYSQKYGVVCVDDCCYPPPAVNWLNPDKSLREQGIEETSMLTLRKKFFFSDQNVDRNDPIQLNLLFVQVWACMGMHGWDGCMEIVCVCYHACS